MARAVYGKYLDAVYDEYENQNRSREEEDDSSESSESDDAEDNVLLDAEKIIEKALFTAIDCNMAHFSARHIMENLRNPSVATDSQGRTPLIVSATIGSVEFAKQLKLGDDETGDGHMRKALCLASKYGHQDFVKYLLSQKSPSLPPHETSNIWTEDNEPSTPVTNAAAGGHHRIAERLVDLMSTEDLKTEFLHAAKYGLDRAMKSILSVATLRDPKIREDCINAMDETSNTALHHAIKGKHARVVHFMILQGASLEMADDSKTTPLAIASEISSLDSMKLLLDAGASTETLIKGGRSVLMQTIWWENEQAVDLLLRYNAKACITGYWSYGASSLLEFTLEWSTDNVLRVLLRHFDKIRKMTSPESIPEDIPTPIEALRTVIKHGRASSVDVLFEIWRKFDDTIHEDDFEIGRE
ncbi:hypothetical protein COL26b_001942 [Colletotrichum chrysophilum]|uniref:uncharacterized protein n=1 Tax=Colletotrichum chrysophilum TaxID=1836956 RepID=UPI0023004058|nr:uncharacterized protein COL26b_001942 [Colletotrichum chrysophilum]KAJ0379791.1 hypothetical protein COL26b_001942 [Colletotrichum chrysophilum]